MNRAFVSRHVEKMKPEIETLAHGLIDRFEKTVSGAAVLFRRYHSRDDDCRMIGIPEEMGPQLLKWSHAYVGMYMFKRSREDELPPTVRPRNSPIMCAA